MSKSYSELMKLKTFKERFNYLAEGSGVGDVTFGSERYLNQALYHSERWKAARNAVIVRDNACDLGVEGMPIGTAVQIHHINPITKDDIINRSSNLFDPENLICTSAETHKAIHYGNENCIRKETPTVRTKNDTIPWR